MLANSKILDGADVDTSKVSILTTVEVRNLNVNKVFKYTLVSEKEADLKTGKISISSPIGKGLLGKKIGEKTTVTTPAGTIDFEIINISI